MITPERPHGIVDEQSEKIARLDADLAAAKERAQTARQALEEAAQIADTAWKDRQLLDDAEASALELDDLSDRVESVAWRIATTIRHRIRAMLDKEPPS